MANISGDNGNNLFLFGTNDQDNIRGLAGNDRMWGFNEDDDMYGGSGSDSLFGGNGDDVMYGDTTGSIIVPPIF